MAETAVTPGNEYVEFWNEVLVPKFVHFKHVLVGSLTHHSAKVFPSLEVKEGDSVVDVGCGFGDTAIELARRVRPAGSVLGIDCRNAFLDYGRADARAARLENVRFVQADVQTYPFEPVHDFCFSRFGTQFFENPVAALRNMRAGLKPGGVMTMIVWRTIGDNPWLGLPKEIVLRYLPPPGEGARTCGSGPFSMADPGVVTRQLEIAGYTGIEFERVDAPLLVGRTPDDAADVSSRWVPRARSTVRPGRRRASSSGARSSAIRSSPPRSSTGSCTMPWSSRSRAPATGCVSTPSSCPSTSASRPSSRRRCRQRAGAAVRPNPEIPLALRADHAWPAPGEDHFGASEENSFGIDTRWRNSTNQCFGSQIHGAALASFEVPGVYLFLELLADDAAVRVGRHPC
jgi:ubiquinone/menaquinone biosynthesis C-methylase UbiE